MYTLPLQVWHGAILFHQVLLSQCVNDYNEAVSGLSKALTSTENWTTSTKHMPMFPSSKPPLQFYNISKLPFSPCKGKICFTFICNSVFTQYNFVHSDFSPSSELFVASARVPHINKMKCLSCLICMKVMTLLFHGDYH